LLGSGPYRKKLKKIMRSSHWALAAAAWLWPIGLAVSAAPVAPLPASVAPSARAVPSAPAVTRAEIDAQDALLHVKVLASPDMEGRGVLTAGLGRAGDYIAGRFRAMGLAGGGDGGGFFQAVDIPLPRKPGARTALTLAGRPLQLGRDFAPSAGAPATRAFAGIVFAGYGLTLPGRYDDYAGIDPRGKLVVCLRYAPGFDPTTGRAVDPAFNAAAPLYLKAENAIRHGAVGLAVVDPPPAAGVAPGAQPEVSVLPLFGPRGPANIASFHLGRPIADWLLSMTGRSLAALRHQIDESGRPASLEIPFDADFTVDWEARSAPSRNVVAVLEGSDPILRQEAVLIGAHYDHLGRGDEGSSLGPIGQVHPGADDNASGTAAVLEIAEAFAAERTRPKRSIVFTAFTGEEKGLIGSAALASRASGKRIVAMVNLDMVGRMKGNVVEVGGGPTAAEWEGIVNAANLEKLTLTFPRRVVPNSDHASFLIRKIPALFLFTGLHGDYHRATDTWDKINGDGLARTARLAFRVVRAVADRDARLAFVEPQWTRPGALGGASGAHGTSVRLGVMPDYQSENGLRVSAVIDGGAGAGGGLRADDVIEAIGARSVSNIDSYMEALALFKPGDVTVLKVRRQGAALELKVTFGAIDGDTGPGGAPSAGDGASAGRGTSAAGPEAPRP
jgi:hypothetical protein